MIAADYVMMFFFWPMAALERLPVTRNWRLEKRAHWGLGISCTLYLSIIVAAVYVLFALIP